MKSKSILFNSLWCLLFSLTALCPVATGKIIYADDDANSLNGGPFWTDANSSEEPVYFADGNLKAAVEEALGITNPTITDMLELDKLDAYRSEISDLTGLEYATNIQILNIYENQISDISPLSGLTNLQRLYLSDNQISDISPLSGLISLRWLVLWGNQISDISSLSGIISLEELDLHRNQISDISPLSGLINIRVLVLANNRISDFSPLSGISLKRLSLGINQISDISPLSGLTSLEDLGLYVNQISDISPLSNLPSLYRLSLSNNQISDITPLSGLISLQQLYLGKNQISDISPLSGLTSLVRLDLPDNQISDISPLSGLKSLEWLYLYKNQISDISPLSGLKSLEQLYLYKNQISDLSPLSRHTYLEWLNLSDNQISDISPLSGLVSLQDLSIRRNPLDADTYTIYIPLIQSYGTTVNYDLPIWRTLTIRSTDCGSVIEPGEGDFDYTNLTVVHIEALADPGYYFVEWTGTAVDAGKIADPYLAGTTVTMDEDYTLHANFEQMHIIHVDDDATGTNNGSSWENAYVCLQDALVEAETGEKPIVIRVAQGIYRPDQRAMIRQDQLRIISSGDWTATFQLIDGVTIKGGYAGFGESNPDARDITQYESILSGDLNADDDPNFTNIWDNSFHVVTASGTQWTAVLDGFTITGGNADGAAPYDNGGGIYNVEGSPMLIDCTLSGNSSAGNGGGMYNSVYSVPTLLNCTFSGNLADLAGGGMYNDKSSPMLVNCAFSENMGGASGGGGIYNDGGIPMLADCDFVGNSTTGSGGGMYNNSSNPVLLSCLFSTNSAPRSGGGMYNRSTSQPNLTNCLFIGNSAMNGGGMENINYSIPILSNCTFSDNFAENEGGGTSNLNNSRLTLVNCILWGDTPDEISGAANVIYSNIKGGWTGIGMNNINIDPLFADPDNDDYHLKSQAGRWDPTTQSWVIDQISSACIDAGRPDTSVGLERFPNGGIINMGAYGGTPEASLSPQQSLPLLSKASNPNPPDGAVGVSRNITLSWTPGFEGALHDVYFGIEFEHVDPSNVNSILVGQNQAQASYDPGLLEYGRTYYWRVDEVDNQGMIITGEVWSFTITSGAKGRSCFTGDNLAWIDGAAIPISEVVAGQIIRSLNISDRVETVQEHEGTFVCYDVLLESGNCVTVAENHYFMAESGQWISLQNLKANTRLKTAKDSIKIETITKQPKPYVGKVYNLKIENSDRYTVGADMVIVRDY